MTAIPEGTNTVSIGVPASPATATTTTGPTVPPHPGGRDDRVVIIGGGPGGYEAALVAAQHGAQVTVVESEGIGGSAVLTDCVPSKSLVAVSDVLTEVSESGRIGVRVDGSDPTAAGIGVDFALLNERILALARAQSGGIAGRLSDAGVEVIAGRGRLVGDAKVEVTHATGRREVLEADVILVATGATARILPEAVPDGERILTWDQLYAIPHLPERLIVVGSGVTGAEFAAAYQALGSRVVLVSSRDQVLPTQDQDAAAVLGEVFKRRGLEVIPRARAVSARTVDDGVVVTLADGSEIRGTHVLMAVGSVPNTDDLGLAEAGVRVDDRGFIDVDRVSRTSVRGIYAAGDCTGVLMLASVAAMQGRIAMRHALGDAVAPLDLQTVSSNVFTSPEIASVGVTQADVDARRINAVGVTLPLRTTARAKMDGVEDGFVKLFARSGTRIVVGGVVVAPRASELIFGLTVAVEQRLTVDELAATITVYPSLSGSIAEAARLLHVPS